MKKITIHLIDSGCYEATVPDDVDALMAWKFVLADGYYQGLDSQGYGHIIPMHAIKMMVVQPISTHEGSKTAQ